MNTVDFIRNAKPSASAKKQITDAQSKVASLLSIVDATEPDRNGRTSALHLAADQAELVFLGEPTLANAEKFHQALVRSEEAKVSFPRIDHAIHALLPQASQSAAPAALEILQSAIDALDAEAEKARSAVSKSEGVFLDATGVDAQHAAAKADLESHRTEIQRDALNWLRAFGHA